MGDVHWLPGIITLALGAALGMIALLLLRRGAAGKASEPAPAGSTPAATPQMLIDDLVQDKERVMRALRDLQDRGGHSSVRDHERLQLELRAARVFKALHEAETAPPPASAAGAVGGPAAAAAPAAAAGGGFVALRWMAVGAFLPLVAMSLYFGTSERKDDMTPMTGGNAALSQPVVATTPMPQAGAPGGPVQGVPPDLRPKASPAVDRARAEVAAHPDQPEAWAALGWALVEAEGWIDVYETARSLRQLDPKAPDGLVLEASVRLAMGQREPAQQLVTDALTIDPSHIQALSFQGALAMQRSDHTGASAAWTQALRIAGPGNGFEELIAMANSGGGPPALPKGHPVSGAGATGLPPAHPAAAGAAAGRDTAAAAAVDRIDGSLRLADGVVAPSGGVLFVIARRKGVQGGPPAAVKRLAAGSFPISFSISSADAMMGGTLPEEVTLTARLDVDGNAGTRSPDDLVAASQDVRAGSSGIELVLQPGG
jgi:tetratricopeptide (TPR) repeat protein